MAHFAEGVGAVGKPSSGLVARGKGAALWLLGATTQRKMDAARLPVIPNQEISTTIRSAPAYIPTFPLPQTGGKRWRGDSIGEPGVKSALQVYMLSAYPHSLPSLFLVTFSLLFPASPHDEAPSQRS